MEVQSKTLSLMTVMQEQRSELFLLPPVSDRRHGDRFRLSFNSALTSLFRAFVGFSHDSDIYFHSLSSIMTLDGR